MVYHRLCTYQKICYVWLWKCAISIHMHAMWTEYPPKHSICRWRDFSPVWRDCIIIAMPCNATQCNALLVGAISDSVLWLHGKYADAPDCTNLSTLLIVEKSSLVIAQICRPPRLHKLIWLHTLIRPDTDTDTTTVEVCRRFCTNKLETTTLIHLYVLLVSLIAASAPCEKHFSPSKYHWNHHIQLPHPNTTSN